MAGCSASTGRQAACPRCKNSFTIPAGGLQLLPANVYVDALVLMKELCMSVDVRPGCGDGDNSTSDNVPQASNRPLQTHGLLS